MNIISIALAHDIPKGKLPSIGEYDDIDAKILEEGKDYVMVKSNENDKQFLGFSILIAILISFGMMSLIMMLAKAI